MSEASADPTEIGPFTVERKLGEGAMGVVYAGYDRRLDRRVALKLVRRQLLHNPAVRERMTREAQAMARLSNPHVVQVYQVGEHDGGIYVAMEYVEGQTLTAWLRTEPRPWRLVLRTLCDAGRGLAAAHAAGLVHRDFKPDNVLVDASGRARVLDFGLVHAEGAPPDSPVDRSNFDGLPDHELAVTAGGEEAKATTDPTGGVERSNLLHWSVRLTQMGNVLGTPAYMSPEQHFGRPAGPSADQFSFSVTLYEAVYGVRPFGGDSWAAIRMQVQEGVVPPPPLESTVPRRIFRVITRGLALEPEARWPSLTAMIAALEHDPWRLRTRVAGVLGLIGVASAISYSLASAQVIGRCDRDAEYLAGVWDAARAAEVSRAFEATHLPFATDTGLRVKSRLDGYARAWIAGRRAACEDHAAGTQTDRLADLRVACLDRRRSHLAALVDVFAAADAAVVENAVQAAASLPGVAACADASDLIAVPPPDDPAVAERVEALRRDLARADVLDKTGRYAEGLELATRARAEAVTLGYAPIEAEAALGEGRLLLATVHPVEADAALLRAVQLGIVNDLHAIAAEAAILRIFVVGNDLARPTEALATAPVAEALVRRGGDDDFLAALLANNIGAIHDLLGDAEAARGRYEGAIEGLRRRGVQDPLEAIVHHNLGVTYLERDDLERARGYFVQAQALFVKILGEAHPLAAHPLNGLGDADLRRGAYEQALPSYLQALALVEAAHGAEHRYLVDPLVGVGKVYVHTGKPEEAARYFSRAVLLGEKFEIRTRAIGEALEALADNAAAAGALPQARQLYERAVTVLDETLGPDSRHGARGALRAGELAAGLGDHEAAIAWFERALARRLGEGDPIRAEASLRLGVELSRRRETASRICALIDVGRANLAETEPRRAEADAVFERLCRPR